jgi:hypothetical protein
MINYFLNTPSTSPIQNEANANTCPSQSPIDSSILTVALQVIHQATTPHSETFPSYSAATPTNQYSETTIEEHASNLREQREAARIAGRENIFLGPVPAPPEFHLDVDQEFNFSNHVSPLYSCYETPIVFNSETPTSEYLSCTENKSPSI